MENRGKGKGKTREGGGGKGEETARRKADGKMTSRQG